MKGRRKSIMRKSGPATPLVEDVGVTSYIHEVNRGLLYDLYQSESDAAKIVNLCKTICDSAKGNTRIVDHREAQNILDQQDSEWRVDSEWTTQKGLIEQIAGFFVNAFARGDIAAIRRFATIAERALAWRSAHGSDPLIHCMRLAHFNLTFTRGGGSPTFNEVLRYCDRVDGGWRGNYSDQDLRKEAKKAGMKFRRDKPGPKKNS